MKQTRKIVFAALCVAIGVILPMAFHSIPNSGSIFLPMHIPVLVSGFLCGPMLGLIVGIATPVLSSLMTGMPPATILPSMICELAVYGLMTGVIFTYFKTKNKAAHIYVSLIGAMILGRLTYGVLNALVFRTGQYSLEVWTTAAFATAIPGIVIQLILIPILLFALEKAQFIKLD